MKSNRKSSKNENIRVKNADGRDRVSLLLYVLYAIVLGISLLIIVKIIHIQFFWETEPEIVKLYRPQSSTVEIKPMRGSILSRDGSVIAVSPSAYKIEMDPSVRRKEFSDSEKGAELEQAWRDSLRKMCEGIARIYGKGTRSTDWYYNRIIEAREKKSHHFDICKNSNYDDYKSLMGLPLAREGQNKSGIIVTSIDSREYPYGSVARSIVGRIASPDRTNIETRWNEDLTGSFGYEHRKKTDRGRLIHDFDSTAVQVVDGSDVRTTLDMQLQLLLDTTLRSHVEMDERIEATSAILLDVRTGAVRAMVNLTRDGQGIFRENYNSLFKRTGEPGSVFKTVALTAAMSYGYVTSVEETIPTNRGKIGRFREDKHIIDFERDSLRKEITYSEGLKMSSNYVFTYLNCKYFLDRPQEYYQRLSEWNLDAPLVTDIGSTAAPFLTSPKDKHWSSRDLGTIAYGYTISLTPLHIATFYNAIANGGRMMRPYFVEDIERDGQIIRQFEPQQIATVCSPEAATEITSALKRVTETGGTANRLRKSPWKVAAKTGTSRICLDKKDQGADPYTAVDGSWKNQGTIVCFFPADRPQYTLLVTMYSGLTRRPVYGGTEPAMVARDIVRYLYAGEPQMIADAPVAEVAIADAPALADPSNGGVPDVTGLTAKDAVYELEHRGYTVVCDGYGLVKYQKSIAEKTIELSLQ